jgi:microcystin-dependent protein
MSVPNTFSPNSTISSADHNQNFSDIADEITNSLALDGQSTMTGQFKAAAGSAAAPGMTFGSDPDTGIYRIGANNLGIAAGGSKIVDVSSTGVAVTGDSDATTVKQGGAILIPPGFIGPYAGSSAPTGWLLCNGQAVSRTTYAALFAVVGTTYGTGDGSSTFNVPDITGRVIAGKESSASRLTSGVSGVDGATLGATGGSQSHTLATTEIPSHQHDVFLKDPGHDHIVTYGSTVAGGSGAADVSGNTQSTKHTNSNTTGITIGSVSGTANDNKVAATGGGGAHNNVQPTIVLNYIIKT